MPGNARAKLTVPEWVLRGLPDPNARQVLSPAQVCALAAAILAAGICAAADATRTLFAVNVAFIVLYLVCSYYRLLLQFLSLNRSAALAPLAPEEPAPLPRYTIMVPLYREASALPGLAAHLRAMDYPADRLQVILLMEDDDASTAAAAQACGLAAAADPAAAAQVGGQRFLCVNVPASLPRTKPKACNYGLRFADGDYLVVYDAEDRPEPDQLRKAVRGFAAAPPEVVCLQAQLNFYNRYRNPLTRLFTAEYSAWFDFCLPGLFLLDAPIPLGGTSNHFRLDALRRIGGWDPFNVTEDCDLGVRLYCAGLRTECLDSTTWEEATFRLRPWVRQRSRWVKGYVQTYLVHMRRPLALLRGMGIERTAHFHLLFGATTFCLLLNPVYWVLTALWLAGCADWLSALYPFWLLIPALVCLLAGNAAFVLSAMLACLGRDHCRLVPWCLLMPVYWVFMSVGAWKGALQLLWRPFFWEKTPHEGVFRMERRAEHGSMGR